MLDLNLEGKRAVVTGASLGIGEAVVKMLKRSWSLCYILRQNKDAIDSLSKYKSENTSSSIKGLIADMSNGESTENFIEETLEEGPIDILVNNVGASPSRNFYICQIKIGRIYMNLTCFLQ